MAILHIQCFRCKKCLIQINKFVHNLAICPIMTEVSCLNWPIMFKVAVRGQMSSWHFYALVYYSWTMLTTFASGGEHKKISDLDSNKMTFQYCMFVLNTFHICYREDIFPLELQYTDDLWFLHQKAIIIDLIHQTLSCRQIRLHADWFLLPNPIHSNF